MNIFSSNLKIHGLEPDSGWVYAFGGKTSTTNTPSNFKSKTDSFKKIETGAKSSKRILKAMNIPNKDAFLTYQTHGNNVYVLDDNSVLPDEVLLIEADSIITNLPQKPIAVLTADCAPIILVDKEKNAIGAVHAGRRGTALRILSKAIRRMKDLYGTENQTLRIGIGPTIGTCCYEVGGECEDEFRNNLAIWRRWTKPSNDGKFFLDLTAANREEALDEGLQEGNIFVSNRCTACENGLFYSYRKEGICGRNVSLVMLS